MYDIREAAEILSVDRVVIFEKLLNDSRYLSDYVNKDNGVTTIDNRGIEVLRALIDGNEMPVFNEAMITTEVKDAKSTNDENAVIEEGGELKTILLEKTKIKEEITALRNQLIALDSELILKDKEIENYSKLLREDIDWIKKMETKLALSLERADSVESVESQAEQSSGLNRFFKSKLFKNKFFKSML